MNPWLELPEGPPWILPMDEASLARWPVDGPVRRDLLPEPFVGDPEAPVVALMKAPGATPGDDAAHGEAAVRAAIRRSHRAGPGWFHPLEPEMEGTPSERWWRAALGDLLAAVGEEAVTRGLFVAQAFPYHVEGGHPVDAFPPPSFQFTVELVLQALERGALLIVVNGIAGWRQALGAERVETAARVRSPLAGHLSRRNLGPAFDQVTELLAGHGAARRARSPHFTEGGVSTVVLERVERSRAARRRCLEHWGFACCACGMDFGDRYGVEAGIGIQVHHLHPLADRRGEHQVDPVRDLRPVCPNCHAVIHSAKPPLHPDALADVLRSRAAVD